MTLPDAFLCEFPVIGLVAPPDVDRYHALGISDTAAWITVAGRAMPGFTAGGRKRDFVLRQIARLDSSEILLLSRARVGLEPPCHLHVGATPDAVKRLPNLPPEQDRDLGGLLYSFLLLQAHHWPEAAKALNDARVKDLGLSPIDPEH